MPLARLSPLVDGGIPDESVVMLNGSPGTGKSTLALQMLADHLKSGGKAVVVTTEGSPAQILQRSALIGAPIQPFLEGDAALRFLDCYSWRTGKPGTTPHTLNVGSLNDLSDVSIKLTDALAEMEHHAKPLLMLFDTPSTLTLHSPGSSILKFMEVAFAKVKSAKGSVLVPIEKDMHDEPFTAAMTTMCDGVLTFKLMEEGDDLARYMRVLTMRTALVHSSKWVKLNLTRVGIDLAAGPGLGPGTTTPATA